MMRHFFRRQPPPWWPAHEPWPPAHRPFGMNRRARRMFFRRAVIGAGALLLFATVGAFALVWIAASRFGLPSWDAPIAVLVLAFSAAFVLLRAFGAMRRFAWPLAAVMDAADRVANGDRGVRVQEYGPPPMRALARSFNAMTDRLDRADRQRRDLMADVAHELRTPLSVLQGRLEGLIDGVYARDDRQLSELLEETRVLSRLIDDLRTLALSDAGVIELQRESINLPELLHDVMHNIERETREKSIAVAIAQPDDPVIVEIDPVRMRQVFTNVVSNAIRHTPATGRVMLTVRAETDHAIVAVADTGEGMPSDEVAKVFDRFYKGKRSSGSGLGLSIARSLVEAHGGSITASSQIGEGTTVTITLPLSRHES